jgi:outer membrane protein assembly factor BamD (BamD/ComL family)
MKRFLICLYFVSSAFPVLSSEKGLIDLADYHYNRKEYYNSITESMRYQYLYPQGELYSQSMIIVGKSYYKGGDNVRALSVLSECYNRFTDREAGERALFYSGLIRIDSGSYNYAARNFREYNYVYNNGIFLEESIINLSLVYALAENYDEAEKKLTEYSEIFPDGKYMKKAEELSVLVKEAESRPEKSLLAAGLLSAIIPGSGYFYTENYILGILSFGTNAALIYGIYDGYKKKKQFQMIFFSVVEFSFYNYSLVGSIKSAHEYNENKDFKKELVLKFKSEF